MIPEMLDRAERLLPRLAYYLEKLGTEPARKTAELLKNPPEALYITAYPRTPVAAERMDEAIRIKEVAVANYFIFRLLGRDEHYVILHPILQDASDRELMKVLAHEFCHAAGYRDEFMPHAVELDLQTEFPEAFADIHEYVKRRAERIRKGEVIDEETLHKTLQTADGRADFRLMLLRYARAVRPVTPRAEAPPLGSRSYGFFKGSPKPVVSRVNRSSLLEVI